MKRIQKATAAEREAYLATKPVYPLYGWYTIKVDLGGYTLTRKCPVEDLRGSWSREDPQYEFISPDGFWLKYEELHTVLGFTLRDLEERLNGDCLIPCPEDCSCR
jgi:hypothetical protein